MHGLTRGEQKSLAYHHAVAEKLEANPLLLTIAHERLRWLEERNAAGRSYYRRWKQLLDGPFEDLLSAMLDPSDRGCALRQENPFVDLVSQRERAAIYKAVAERIDAGMQA